MLCLMLVCCFRDVESLPYDDMATGMKSGVKDPSFERKECAFESRCKRFVYPAQPDVSIDPLDRTLP